jgi:nitrate/nitrite-specific signal transduction histidine kinase
MDLPFRRNMLLAVKEALNNAAKHSEATDLLLQIHRRGHGLAVVVRDNGKGFDPTHTKLERNGLDNMTQRMSEMGGSCTVTSRLGGGCQVEFHIPFLQVRRRPWWSRWQSGHDLARSHPLLPAPKDHHVQASSCE